MDVNDLITIILKCNEALSRGFVQWENKQMTDYQLGVIREWCWSTLEGRNRLLRERLGIELYVDILFDCSTGVLSIDMKIRRALS